MTLTAFKKWRTEMEYTQAEAAALLNVSPSQIANWDTGVDRSTGKPAIPPYSVRVLMRLDAEGRRIEPWPEKLT
jgi:predicted transcriptional regulator